MKDSEHVTLQPEADAQTTIVHVYAAEDQAERVPLQLEADAQTTIDEVTAAMTARNWCLVPSPEMAVRIYRRYGPEHDLEAGS
jgi:hypothetical protein